MINKGNKCFISIFLVLSVLQISFVRTLHFLSEDHHGTDCHASGSDRHYHDGDHGHHDCYFLNFVLKSPVPKKEQNIEGFDNIWRQAISQKALFNYTSFLLDSLFKRGPPSLSTL